MTKLEVRILCRILPKSIDELDLCMPSNLPNRNDDDNLYEMVKKHQRIVRDYKRQILAKRLEEYESTIEQNEFIYQKELLNFESSLGNEENNQINEHLMNCLYNYLHC